MKIIVGDNADVRRVSLVLTAHKKPCEVTVKPYRAKRTLEQNALMWKWYHFIKTHLADNAGEYVSEDEIAEFFRGKFLPTKSVTVLGETIDIKTSTTGLSVDEMSEYLSRIDEYCLTKLGLSLPQEQRL